MIWKFYLALICTSCATLLLRAQPYKPFTNPALTWCEFVRMDVGTHGSIWYSEEFFYQGDSLIGGVKYSRLVGQNLAGGFSTRYFYVYEDTSAQRVYAFLYYPPTDSVTQILLYDFKAQIGDTVFHVADRSSFSVVNNVRMLMTYGIVRKTIDITTNYQETYSWVEGVGATLYGLLGTYTPGGHWVVLATGTFENNHLKYGTKCMTTGIAESDENDVPIIAQQHYINEIRCRSDASELEIEITNLLGQTVRSEKGFSVNIADLPKAVYILKTVDHEGRHYTQKFLKE